MFTRFFRQIVIIYKNLKIQDLLSLIIYSFNQLSATHRLNKTCTQRFGPSIDARGLKALERALNEKSGASSDLTFSTRESII